MIYNSLPSGSSASHSTDISSPLPSPSLSYSPPTPLPFASAASDQPQLITHPFIYSGGVAALAGILASLAPLSSGSNSSYIYLTCNSSHNYPAYTQTNSLMVVNLHGHSASEPQRTGRSSSITRHIKVTVLPGVSLAAFYRHYPLSVHTLQKMEEYHRAAILDFPMHQASGKPKDIKAFISDFLSQMNLDLSEKYPIFVSGIAPCYDNESMDNDSNQDVHIEDTTSRVIINQTTNLDNFLCSVVHIQHSWWNSTQPINIEEINDHLTSLRGELLEHISTTGQFPVSVTVVWPQQEQLAPFTVPPGNDADDDISLAYNIQQLGGSMSNTIHVILSDAGSIYHPNSQYTSYTRLEESNPVLFFIIPQTVKLSMPLHYFQNLVINSQRLVTTADVALTVLSLSDFSISISPVTYHLNPHPLYLRPECRSSLSSDCYCPGSKSFAFKGRIYSLFPHT